MAVPTSAPHPDTGFVWGGASGTQWVSAQAATRHFDVELSDGQRLLQIPLCRIRAATKKANSTTDKAKPTGILRYAKPCDVFTHERGKPSPDAAAAATTTATTTDPAKPPRTKRKAPELTPLQKTIREFFILREI